MTGMAGSLTAGLYAAFMLARGRADGLRLVAADTNATGRSFWAIAACVPIVVGMRVLAIAPPNPGLPMWRLLARDLVTFLVAWLLYALLTHRVANALGRGDRWPRFLAAWNWCNVAENLIILLGAVPGVLGAPAVLDQASELFALGWALWIEWYVTRTGLGVSVLMAVWLVLVDQAVGLITNGLGQMLTGG
jgi:hypothetical protein